MKNAAWGRGPWDNEPDREEWRDEATGLPCIALRQDEMGHWCGYVAVPPGHPAHGKGYEDVPAEVHGGVTYARECNDRVCHKPAPGESDGVWWIGFDCAHSGDLSPGGRTVMLEFFSGTNRGGKYRPLSYVRSECSKLARQLKGMA